MSIVMPSVLGDIYTLINNAPLYFRYLPVKDIYIVGPSNIEQIVKDAHDDRLIFMNENEFVDVPKIRALYAARCSVKLKRANWYVQQFIKMQFAKFIQDEYYLIWDSDTLPLKTTPLFDKASGKPIMQWEIIKSISTCGYHDTHVNILPGINGDWYGISFVREHMVIRTEYMRELIWEIEANPKTKGSNFQEKIINSVAVHNLPEIGFSEFQEYGGFVNWKYPDAYILDNRWHSLRDPKRLCDNVASFTDEEIRWLASGYDAVSIEKWQIPTKISALIHFRLFRALFPPITLEILAKPRRLGKYMLPKKYRNRVVSFIKRTLHLR